jgi:phage portal protein BeeE
MVGIVFTSLEDNKIIHELLYIVEWERSPKLSWKEWFGFTKPRDAPDAELLQIEDNVRDSGGVFVFGMTNSGELVNEKSALQISTVYACVRLLAETVASLPLHLYKFTDTGAGKERAAEHPLYKILYR